MRVTVRLTPGGGRDAIDGVTDGALRARVAAKPIAGAANKALCELLADALGIAAGRVRIASGQGSRRKIVELEGVSAETLRSRWPGIEV